MIYFYILILFSNALNSNFMYNTYILDFLLIKFFTFALDITNFILLLTIFTINYFANQIKYQI